MKPRRPAFRSNQNGSEQSVKVEESRKVFVRGYFDSDVTDVIMVMHFSIQ